MAVLLLVAAGVLYLVFFAADWKNYPSTHRDDPHVVLAQDPEDEIVAEAERLREELQDLLSQEFGGTWHQLTYSDLQHNLDNGYGGYSMLSSYWSGIWRAVAPPDHIEGLDAREALSRTFEEFAAAEGLASISFLNEEPEVRTGENLRRYGADSPAEQAAWLFTATSDDPLVPLSISAGVYDSRIEVHDAFTGSLFLRNESGGFDDPGENVYFWVVVSAPGLLSSDNRAEFEERMSQYEGKIRPQPEDE